MVRIHHYDPSKLLGQRITETHVSLSCHAEQWLDGVAQGLIDKSLEFHYIPNKEVFRPDGERWYVA